MKSDRSVSKTLQPRFVPFFRSKFPGLFQDSYWFFQDSKIYINPFTPKIYMLILLTVCHTFHIFLLEFNRFPELSRTSSPFPRLSRFSRTRTNPVQSKTLFLSLMEQFFWQTVYRNCTTLNEGTGFKKTLARCIWNRLRVNHCKVLFSESASITFLFHSRSSYM